MGIVDTLRRHSREVLKLEGDHAAEFLKLLRDSREQLLGRLMGGDTANVLDGFRIRSILGETEASIRALELKAIGKWGATSEEALDLAIGHIGDEIGKMSRAFGGESLNVAIDAQKVLADPARGLLANNYESSVKRYGLDVLNQARQRIFIGLRTGETVGDVARAIGGQAGPLGQFGQVNAERLVRTEVSSAYGSAHHSGIEAAAEQIPGLKKVWLHLSSYPCKFCMPLHGTERPIDGTWTIRSGRRTKEVAHPPSHPRCSCRAAAMKASWRAGLKDLGYLKKQDTEAPAEM